MAASYVVDIHALIWFMTGDPRLSPSARSSLSDPLAELFIPAIVLAEACWIVEHGRSSIPDVPQFLAALGRDTRIRVVPLDRTTVEEASRLTRMGEMDDRQIVATTVLLFQTGANVILVTADANITASGAVPVLW